jgi:hypothetical protein
MGRLTHWVKRPLQGDFHPSIRSKKMLKDEFVKEHKLSLGIELIGKLND